MSPHLSPRDLSIRWKILAILVLPVLILLSLTGYLVNTARIDANDASFIRSEAKAIRPTSDLLLALGDEQASMNLTLLATPQQRAEMLGRLRKDTALTLTAAKSWKDAVNAVNSSRLSPEALTTQRGIMKQLDGLAQLRTQVVAGTVDVKTANSSVEAIASTIDTMVQSTSGLMKDSTLLQQARSFSLLSAYRNDVFTAGQAVIISAATPTVDLQLVQEGIVAAGNAQTAYTNALAALPPADAKALDASIGANHRLYIPALEGLLVNRAKGQPIVLPPGTLDLFDSFSKSMTTAINGIATRLEQRATQLVDDANNRVALFVGLLVAAFVFSVAHGLFRSRRVVRPLKRLTISAGEISIELPKMVERMQTPGEGPGVEIQPLPVHSRDEIGALAMAFNAVNETTVRVALEQAALRASIASMFVNVARRNQALLGRQLSALERMEEQEDDPDLLQELFHLDHMTTRMRRNADSLLVLAGIDTSRRLRSPLPLSDVIRTATSEIEHYSRVDVTAVTDPDVDGRYALTVAHLLAELLENATRFSDPSTRVDVRTVMVQDTVQVVVTDHGLGMSDDEIATANARIVELPNMELAVSERLGFFVVGRLAQRLGCHVWLQRHEPRGTVAVLTLPASVLAGASLNSSGSVPALPVQSGPVAPAQRTAAPAAAAAPVALAPEVPVQAPPAAVETVAGPAATLSILPGVPMQQAPQASAATLPQRRRPAEAAAPAAPVEPAPAPEAPAAAVDERATWAFSELSQISSQAGGYTPQFVPSEESAPGPVAVSEPGTLTRRTPRAVEPQQVQEDDEVPPRTRTASEVRGNLSAFRSAVQRARADVSVTRREHDENDR